MEGQLQFRLGPKLANKIPVDKIDYQWPILTTQFSIGSIQEAEKQIIKENHLNEINKWRQLTSKGYFNSNTEKEVIIYISYLNR